MAIVNAADCRPGALSIWGSREDGVLTVGVGSRRWCGDGPRDLKTLEVQPDLTDVGAGPADGQLAGGGGGVAGPGEVGVVQEDGAVTANFGILKIII